MNFDFDSKTRRKLGFDLIEVVDNYFSSLTDRSVQPPAEDRVYTAHRSSLPEMGEDPSQVFHQVSRELIDRGFHVPSANYLGMMNPTPTYMAFLGEALVSALNPQLASLDRSETASRIEAETISWISNLVGWNGASGGTFTTGGNEANMSALAMALSSMFPEIVDDGLLSIGAQPVFYASSEAHHSLEKSAGLLGLGRKALRRIPVNELLHLDTNELERAIREDLRSGDKPFCVVATAGTTSSGAVDQISELHEVCRRYNIWLHVDGAYGAAVLFSKRHRDLVRGIEFADSITFDPHKWLAMPFSAGLLLTQHPSALEKTFSVACPYLKKAPAGTLPDNRNISAQWSRRMNSLKLWLTLRVHGRRAYEEMINRQMKMAQEFATWVRESEYFELAAHQVLPILNLRVRANIRGAHELPALHAAIIDEVNRDGQRWISAATVNGESVIRTMVISYLTEERHIKDLQNALLSACRKQLPSAELETGPLLESSLPASIQLTPATLGFPTA
jgi:glutamate/tyrosine decarboxylase-like PLP-dependent enzyme